jgi:NADH:ubiquinone oxidoreductase subunit E
MDLELEKIDVILKEFPEVQGNLISILHEVQSLYNYLPEEALRYLSQKIRVPLTQLYSIATFYHFFSLTRKGKHSVNVCLGTACHVKGSPRILSLVKRKLSIEEGETTPDMGFTLNTVRCIGACSLAPVMVVDKDTHGNVTNPMVPEILKKYE